MVTAAVPETVPVQDFNPLTETKLYVVVIAAPPGDGTVAAGVGVNVYGFALIPVKLVTTEPLVYEKLNGPTPVKLTLNCPCELLEQKAELPESVAVGNAKILTESATVSPTQPCELVSTTLTANKPAVVPQLIVMAFVLAPDAFVPPVIIQL